MSFEIYFSITPKMSLHQKLPFFSKYYWKRNLCFPEKIINKGGQFLMEKYAKHILFLLHLMVPTGAVENLFFIVPKK